MATTWGTWRAWAAVVVALSACGPAHAFYFEGWPGSGTPKPVTLTPQVTAPLGEPVPVGPTEPVDRTPPVGPGPMPTPEPASGVLGLLGLGAVLARRFRARRPG